MEKQNLAVLVLDEKKGNKTERLTDNSCDYCGKSLPKRHFVSEYDGHYCDSNCHRMYTED